MPVGLHKGPLQKQRNRNCNSALDELRCMQLPSVCVRSRHADAAVAFCFARPDVRLRRGERLDSDQMSFGLEELEADFARAEARRAAAMPQASADLIQAAPAKLPHRVPLSAHLPRVETVIPVPHDACPPREGVHLRLEPSSHDCLASRLYSTARAR